MTNRDRIGAPIPTLLSNASQPTVAQLKAAGISALSNAGRSQQQIRNCVSALNGFIHLFSLDDSSPLGALFREEFDKRFIHYQDVMTDSLARRTLKDRCEQILFWRTTHDALPDEDRLPASFSLALSIAFAHSGLTKAAVCRAIGLAAPSFNRWLDGSGFPSSNCVSQVSDLEALFQLPKGTLVRRLPQRQRQRYARRQTDTPARPITQFGERQRRNRGNSQAFHVPSTPRLREQWRQLCAHKTDATRPHATVHNTWRLKPLARTGIRVQWPMLVNGQVCATAGVQYPQIRAFLGFLATPTAAGGHELPLTQVDTLAWLIRSNYVIDYVSLLQCRADGIRHNGLFTFLDLVRSHLRPYTGFLWLHPELAATLPSAPPALDGETPSAAWQRTCEASYQAVLAHGRRLKAQGKPVRSRDPEEQLTEILSSAFPLKYLVRLVQELERDEPPIAHSRDHATWVRDVLMLRLLLHHPLRVSHFSVMTFRGARPNLYRNADGGWQVRFEPSDFKNEKGAANSRYDITLHPAVAAWVNRYLSEARPELWLADTSNYLFLPSRPGNRVRRSAERRAVAFEPAGGLWPADVISIRIKRLVERYGELQIPFGPHAFRHILATDHLRRHPRDYLTVAQMLHDKLETVMHHYAHLEVADGVRTIRSSIEEAEHALAEERGLK